MRDPRKDPQAGDSLTFRGWTVSVMARAGDSVRYTRARRGDPAEGPREQTMAAWLAWASEAKVSERGGDACVVTPCVSGCCTGCRGYLARETHVSDAGIFCAECCPAKKHVGRKPRGAAA